MKRIDFQLMPLDELWTLHKAIGSMLATKLEAEKRELRPKVPASFEGETAAPAVPQGLPEIP